MDRYDSLIVLQLCMIFTIGLIGVECVVLWLTLDYYYIFILGVLVITYFCELGYYIHFKINSKKGRKKFDKKKKK